MDINQYSRKGKTKEEKLLDLEHVSAEDITEILYKARELKLKKQFGEADKTLEGKKIALITKHAFAQSRIAFEIAVSELSAYPLVLDLSGAEIESVLKDKDTALSICSYGIDAFTLDTSVPQDAFVMQDYVRVPVINANGQDSPVSALATVFTAWEELGTLKNVNFCMVGDFNAYDKCLVHALIKLGANVTIVAPRDFAPDDHLISYCEQYGEINYTDDLIFGIKNADAVYVTPNDFSENYVLNLLAFSFAKENCLFLHTIPFLRGKEVACEIIDGKNSKVYKQAENLLHVEKAVLSLIVGNK